MVIHLAHFCSSALLQATEGTRLHLMLMRIHIYTHVMHIHGMHCIMHAHALQSSHHAQNIQHNMHIVPCLFLNNTCSVFGLRAHVCAVTDLQSARSQLCGVSIMSRYHLRRIACACATTHLSLLLISCNNAALHRPFACLWHCCHMLVIQ